MISEDRTSNTGKRSYIQRQNRWGCTPHDLAFMQGHKSICAFLQQSSNEVRTALHACLHLTQRADCARDCFGSSRLPWSCVGRDPARAGPQRTTGKGGSAAQSASSASCGFHSACVIDPQYLDVGLFSPHLFQDELRNMVSEFQKQRRGESDGHSDDDGEYNDVHSDIV